MQSSCYKLPWCKIVILQIENKRKDLAARITLAETSATVKKVVATDIDARYNLFCQLSFAKTCTVLCVTVTCVRAVITKKRTRF